MQANKYDGNNQFSQRDERKINLFASKHIGEQADCERERASEVAENFNRQHQEGQPPYWSQELLEVSSSVRLDASRMIKNENRDGHSEGNHGIHGWRIEPGNEA